MLLMLLLCEAEGAFWCVGFGNKSRRVLAIRQGKYAYVHKVPKAMERFLSEAQFLRLLFSLKKSDSCIVRGNRVVCISVSDSSAAGCPVRGSRGACCCCWDNIMRSRGWRM